MRKRIGAIIAAVFSYECFEPYLAVYDMVYKNMGFGNGIFSWCKQQEKK